MNEPLVIGEISLIEGATNASDYTHYGARIYMPGDSVKFGGLALEEWVAANSKLQRVVLDGGQVNYDFSTASVQIQVTLSDLEDSFIGGSGDDIILGKGGGDTLTGGAGKDHFVFVHFEDSNAQNPNRITDFNPSDDKIVFSATPMSGVMQQAISSGGITHLFQENTLGSEMKQLLYVYNDSAETHLYVDSNLSGRYDEYDFHLILEVSSLHYRITDKLFSYTVDASV